jgi:hypothetical protein
LRHGFYSRKFHDLEVVDLGQVKGGLQDEMAMLRVSIRRVFERATEFGDEFAEKGPGSELFALSQLLTTLGIATTRLAHTLRTQKFLEPRIIRWHDRSIHAIMISCVTILRMEVKGCHEARRLKS